MTRVHDMDGQRFGRLVVIGPAATAGSRELWLCRCDCGETIVTRRSRLLHGNTKSCGCLRRTRIAEDNRRHSLSNTPTHRSWIEMRRRCRASGRVTSPYYVDRGVVVCERWHAFANFLADMGERPAGTTLDRYPDNRGNYEPGNCRWATPAQQRANMAGRRTLTEDIRQEIRGRLEHGESARSVASRVGFSRSLVDQVRAGSR